MLPLLRLLSHLPPAWLHALGEARTRRARPAAIASAAKSSLELARILVRDERREAQRPQRRLHRKFIAGEVR